MAARPRRAADSPRLLKIAAWAWPLPFLINSAGWVFTEMGRQPWIVQGLLKTGRGARRRVSTREIGSPPRLHAVYALLGGIVLLAIHPARAARGAYEHERAPPEPGEAVLLAFAY